MNVTFEKISGEESWAIFDAAAQREMGMSGDEFAARWDAGEFDGRQTIEAMQVAMLRPSGR